METYIFLSVQSDHISAAVKHEGQPAYTAKLETTYDWKKLVNTEIERVREDEPIEDTYDRITVMCSSSLDFPEESTSDPAILELTKALR